MRLQQIQHQKIFLEGYSQAGVGTSVVLPQLHACFDVAQGHDFNWPMRHFFITHGHLDHASGIPYIVSQRALNHSQTPIFYVPAPIVKPLQQIMAAWAEIDAYQGPHEFIPVDLNSKFQLNAQHVVRPFATVHRVPSFGYCIFEQKKHLREDLRSCTPNELAKRRSLGETLETFTETPIFAFTGDTQIDFLDHAPEWVLNAQVLVMECTYLDSRKSVADAKKWGHIHLDELLPRLKELQNEKIILSHFSRRYTNHEIPQILKQRLSEEEQQRIVPLI